MSFLYGFDGAAWDRLRSLGDDADAVAVGALGRLPVASRLYGFDGLNFNRLRTHTASQTIDAAWPRLVGSSLIYGFGPGANVFNAVSVIGDNIANPTAGKIATLPARANAVAPTWTEGLAVPLSVDLSGTLRTTAGAGGGFTPYTRQAAWDGVYSFTLVDAAGVAAANVFLSLFNPAASGKVVVLLEASVESYSVAISTPKNSMRLTRTTAASVGTLQAAAAINKFQTTDPNPASEVRTVNPTITAAAEVDAFGPNENITAAAGNSISRRTQDLLPEWGEFTLVAGEGVAFRQTIAGDVDQTWDLKITWVER